jgi:UDP-N-acetylmuramoyl-L-alanyl-D-glutamate--2,6-diaminopimelate ligase
LFCCLPGSTVDGHEYAAVAVERGAVALLVERVLPLAVPQVVVPSARRAMAIAAANAYGRPAESMRMVGVTGTNGKTTTVAMVQAMLDANGIRTATLGTLAARLPDAPPTTPDSSDLQALLASFRDEGYDAVAMEVSSEGLNAARVDAITYDVAAFTNLSQDHLNVHGTMENYFAAKAQLFTPARARHAVICIDTDWGSRLAGIAEDLGVPVTRCSVRDVVIDYVEGPHTTVRWHDARGTIHLAGEHNLANAVVAATIGEVLGLTPAQVIAGLASLTSVAGRFEYVDAGQPFAVVVDYAHTPDGVAVALRAARRAASVDGRVTIVVGAGGDRDPAKRPQMAAIAEELADRVVLTSDNPRSEDPRAILEQMQVGLRDPNRVELVPDRARAIELALDGAEAGDLILIAGKGHETTQTIGDQVLPFDDREVARAALRARGYGR